MSREMVSNDITIQIVNNPGEAPKYEPHQWTMLKIQKAIVVGKGTVKGNPTIDIHFVDADGREYLVMATAGIIEGLGAAVAGKRKRDTGN
jgi:hypothetical protein